MPDFIDIADQQEDERIRLIGEAAMTGEAVAFVTDSEPGKADRYISKLTTRFPRLTVIERHNGPIKGAVTVRMGLREDLN